MTISSTTTKNTYNGDGSTTIFAYTFEILVNTDLLVQLKNTTTGVITTSTLGVDYTVSNAGVSTGGNVTFTTAPATGNVIIILRNVPATQLLALAEYDTFPAASIDNALDKLTMLIQQIDELTGRNITLDPAVTGFSSVMPSPPAAGYSVVSNASNNGFTWGLVTGTGSYSFGAGTGFLYQTASGMSSTITIQGTTNQITGTLSGSNFTLSLPTTINAPGAINFLQATSVASASTTPIFAALGNSVTITGTTTITQFDTAQNGATRWVAFAGILQLTYDATKLILPTAANITTAAGDEALVKSLGSGNSKIIAYTRASGGSLGTPMTITRLTSGSAATYTTPAGCVRIRVKCRGPGGNGGNGSGTTNQGGAGGGQGGYCESIINNPAATYTYTIGSPGSATTFSGGSMVANSGSNGGALTIGALGGTASGGNIDNRTGAVGQGTGFDGANYFAGAGGGEGAGNGKTSGNVNGTAASANSGGGGGGGIGTGTGGAGGTGLIIIEEYYNV